MSTVVTLRADGCGTPGGVRAALTALALPPDLLAAYTDLRLARADRLAQLSRLRRQIRELQGQADQLAHEELELGMRLDHLKAKHPALPMAMLPNDYHPGPRCSCRECLREYPGLER